MTLQSASATSIYFERVELRHFRNLDELAIEPVPRLNVIVGENGQGKTSLLEALYLVAATRSFRSERLRTLIQDGQSQSRVVARIRERGYDREQSVLLTPRLRSVLLDGKKPERLGRYATRTPVVVFQPGDISLVQGAATTRRKLLDRVALFLEPATLDVRQRYAHALRERQAALEQRGPNARELHAYESVLAQLGAEFARLRLCAAETLQTALIPIFERLSSPGLNLTPQYTPKGTTNPVEYLAELHARRIRDQRAGAASFGPHRDELELRVDGRAAREHASQGQQRLLALSLKLAELECVQNARGVTPVLLLDDVSSELDPLRTEAVEQVVSQTACQVFVTTTRRELFPAFGDTLRRDYDLSAGKLRIAGG